MRTERQHTDNNNNQKLSRGVQHTQNLQGQWRSFIDPHWLRFQPILWSCVPSVHIQLALATAVMRFNGVQSNANQWKCVLFRKQHGKPSYWLHRSESMRSVLICRVNTIRKETYKKHTRLQTLKKLLRNLHVKHGTTQSIIHGGCVWGWLPPAGWDWLVESKAAPAPTAVFRDSSDQILRTWKTATGPTLSTDGIHGGCSLLIKIDKTF